MGIYGFSIGLGIIVPIGYFEHKFKSQILRADLEDSEDDYQRLVQKLTGDDDIKAIFLGHDAFDGRDGVFDMDVLDGVENSTSLEQIKNLLAEYPSTLGTLMFIGYVRDLESAELSYSVKTSELLYGLPGFLNEIVQYYLELCKTEIDLSALQINQKALIWTFAHDCCQCCT